MSRSDVLDPARSTRSGIDRCPPEVVEAAAPIGSASLHEAGGRIGALPAAIKPVGAGMRVAGPALTVHSPPGDNLWLHRAIYVAEPGDVLVVHVSGAHEFGYWGEIMATAAKVRRLAGLVIDGCVRDGALLRDIGFPVFARGLAIRGTGKDPGALGWLNAPVQLGRQVARAGDLMVGDEDGVVCLPREHAPEIVARALAREAGELDILRRLERGETTLSIYNLHPPRAG